MKKMIVALILFSAVSDLQAVTTNFNSITISGELNSPTPISGVRVWIRSGGSSGAVVGTASEVSLIPDAGGFFSTKTYITDPGPWIFQTGSDYVVQLTSSTNEIISTFSITAVPFALTVRGDAQPGNQNIFGAYGNVGIGTTTPSYRLHVTSAAGTGGDMVVISTGTVDIIRMTGAGEIYATKYYGDISGATGLPAGDNLGNHTATANLLMGGKQIINASSITATETITASTYQISGVNVLISPGSSLAVGKSAGGNGYGANVFIGPSAGAGNFHGFSNTFMGYESGKLLNSGNGNTGIGQNAGYRIGDGASNTYIGVNTGMKAVNGYDDTCIGAFSCSNADVAGGNTVLGSRAGESFTSGSYNVFLGKHAAKNKLSGDSNIVIGVDQDLSSPSASSELNIGGVIFGNLAAKTIGISTRTPQAALDVVSTGTASNIYVQIWRASDAAIKSSMSATGVMMASKFIGDGSGLTGVTASGSVQKTGDTMTGQLTLSNSTLTISGSAFSVGGSTFVVANGIVTARVLGVGASPSPTSSIALQVYGSQNEIFNLRDANAQLFGFGTESAGANFGGRFYFNASPLAGMESNGGWLIGSGYVGNNAPANGMIIEGNVGIGVTVPVTKLDIASEANTDKIRMTVPHSAGLVETGIEFIRDTQVAGAKIQTIRNGSLGGIGLNFYTTADQAAEAAGTYSNRVTLDRGGNVGIGATAPVTKLQLPATGDAYTGGLLISPTTEIVGLSLWHDNNGFSTEYIDSRYDNAGAATIFRMRANGTPVNAMAILGSGNVGIGTTAPGAKLDVAGAGSFTNIWSSGTVTATSFNGNGASLAALNASSLTSGTVADVRLSANVELLDANNTASGNKTFTGTVALPTRDKISFGNELSNSSSTKLTSDWLKTDTTFAGATSHVLGSSLTVTTNGGRLMVGFSGSVSNGAATSSVYLTIKINSAFFISSTVGIVHAVITSSNLRQNGSFVVMTDPLPASTYTIGLYSMVDGGTGGLRCDAATMKTNCQFWVYELR